jgi:chromosome segregation ATPase
MTDEELKALVASLAEAQKKTDEQMNHTDQQMKRTGEQLKRTGEQLKRTEELIRLNAISQKETKEQMKRADEQFKRTDEQFKRTDEQFKRTDEQFKRTDEQFKRTDEQFKRTDEQLKRTDEQLKRTDEQLKRTDEQLKRTDEKLERIGITVGNIGQNQGDVAEEFFLHSLMKDNRLGSIRFDDVVKNMEKHRGRIHEEYDLVMTNGNAIGIVEVKYKAHIKDLDKLDRKMKHFKPLFPIYESFRQYGAIAAFHINEDAKQEALERGYFVLQRSGDLVHTESAENLAVL